MATRKINSLYNYKVPNLINGVSSQPVRYRLPNQANICTNFWPSVSTGLIRRPGSRFVNTLSDEALENSTFVHTIDRTELEKYMVVVRPEGDLKVYNLITGDECTLINSVGNTDYVTVDDPVENIRALTVADETFLLNRNVATGMTSDVVENPRHDAIVWLKQVAEEGDFIITAEDSAGTSKTFTVNKTDVSHMNSQEIMEEFVIKINADGTFTATRENHVIIIDPSDETLDIERVVVEDPIAGTGLEVVHREVDQISDLPDRAPQGFVIKVRGDENRNQDDFYVKFETADGLDYWEMGRGSWVETAAPNITYKIASELMPHVLENTGFNQFTYKKVTWGERVVGDEESAEVPSFIDNKINGMAFWQNRFVLFSKDQVSMSQTGEFYNFFPTTTLVIPDDERVDIRISTPRSGDILYALPYNNRLLLFTREIQFALYGDPVITPGNVSVFPVTYFPYDGNYAPAGISRFIYFGSNRSDYFQTLEYFQETDGVTYDAVNISEHASRVVPSNIQDLTVSADVEAICLTPETDGNTLYLYKTFWQENRKVQSAWFDFEFPEVDRIVASKFVRNVLYLVLVRDNTTYLEALEFTDDDTEVGFPWSPHMDLRLSSEDAVESYDILTNKTTIESPVFYKAGLEFLFVSEDKRVISVTTLSGNKVEIEGDVTGVRYFVGIPFDSIYELPVLVLKPGREGNPTDILKYEQVLSVRTNYEDSMSFSIELDGGPWGVSTKTLGVYRIGEEPVGSEWNLKDGHEEIISGIPGDSLKVRLKSIGSFPMKPLSISYNVRADITKEQV